MCDDVMDGYKERREESSIFGFTHTQDMKRFGVLFLALSAILLVLSCRVYRQTDDEEREARISLLSFFGSAHKLSSPP